MAVRRESVVIEVQEDLSSKMARAAAATALANAELERMNGQRSDGLRRTSADADTASQRLRRLSEDLNRINTDATRLTGSLDRNRAGFDNASRGMSGLAAGALTLLPIIPRIGAAAVEPLAGMASGLGAVAGAFGVTILAAHGLGDAMKAINNFEADRTPENLEKAKEALTKVGPDGAKFLTYLDSLEPRLRRLQMMARAGLLPGLQGGIDALLTRLPQVRTYVENVSRAVGDIAKETGEGLAGPKFDRFFDYINHSASPILRDFAAAAGNVGEGLANLIVAVDPLTVSFDKGFRSMTHEFAQWSRHLDDNGSFQNFLTYVQESGPKVISLIDSLSTSLVSIARAASPVGDVELNLITDVVKVLGSLADSDLGTPIIAAAIAFKSLNLALSTTSRLAGSSSFLGGWFGARRTGLTTGFRELPGALNTITTSWLTAGAASQRQSARVSAAYGSLRRLGSEAFQAAAPVAAMALVTSGVADKMGLTNTATLTLMGTMGGPWGSAVGAATGLMIDLGKANDTTKQAAIGLDSALKSSTATFASSTAAYQSYMDTVNQRYETPSLAGKLGTEKDLIFGGYGGSQMQKDVDGYNQAGEALADIQLAGNMLAKTMGVVSVSMDNNRITAAQWDEALQRANPAMQALGISTDDLINGVKDGSIIKMVAAIEHWTAASDSARGRQKELSAAVAALGNATVSTADKADRLQQALDNLLSPQLDLTAAQDAWTTSLRTLSKDLDKNNKTLQGNSNAAIQNRAAMQQRVDGYEQLLVAEAKSGASSDELIAKAKTMSASLLAAGHAAGITTADMQKYVAQLKLTPKQLSTLIRLNTTPAERAAMALNARLNAELRDRVVNVRIVQSGSFHGGLQLGSARGNLIPAYANGGLDRANAHQPELYRGGLTRVWGEPETRGEAYIPLANDSRRPRAKNILEQTAGIMNGRVAWFADGGVTDTKKRPLHGKIGHVTNDQEYAWLDAAIANANDQIHSLTSGLRDMNHEVDAATKAYDKQNRKVDALTSRSDSLAASVVSGLRSDIFAPSAGSTNIYAAGATGAGVVDPLAILRGDISQTKKFNSLRNQLEDRGLSGGALQAAEQAGVTGLQTIASYSKSQLTAYEDAYAQRQRLSRQAGSTAAFNIYGERLGVAVSELKALRQQVHQLEQDQRQMEKARDRARDARDRAKNRQDDLRADHIGRTVADGVNKGARNGHRRRRGGGSQVTAVKV